MDQEFHERLPHELRSGTSGCQNVQQAVDGEQQGDLTHFHQLLDGTLPPESWQSFVPDSAQQLLDVWMGHELRNRSNCPN